MNKRKNKKQKNWHKIGIRFLHAAYVDFNAFAAISWIDIYIYMFILALFRIIYMRFVNSTRQTECVFVCVYAIDVHDAENLCNIANSLLEHLYADAFTHSTSL